MHAKVALLRKGLFFCREQVKKAVPRFQNILRGDGVESTDQLAQGGDISDINDDEDGDSDGSGDDGEAYDLSTPITNHDIVVNMRPFDNNSVVWIWEFPHSVSQSTYQDRNGSNAYIHTYIHKLYLSSDFSVAYIASISDPNLLI